ncbi:MAG: hypothetical protein IJL48_00720 [Bacteroidales bacterium]|nr:hypothetical protein [Bacteroidales bacterium]
MKRTDFDLDEMQRLWQKQSRALEGHSLISEDEMRRAMQRTRKAEVRPLHLWRRVAAVAAVLIVAAVAVWQWPAQPAIPQLAKAAQGPRNNRNNRNNQNNQKTQSTQSIQNTPTSPTLIAKSPAQKVVESRVAAQIEESPQFIAPVAVEEVPADETLLAQAPAPQKTVWPNRQSATDTLTVYTTRLVQYGTPKRKSLTETLFEPVLASL